ncbi:MAG: aminotransferase class V-fold PLP-dependent enzyme [Candidatus Atribacteria bacterium]|nr:MAG: aminotransferase class V-fold PLP-dependent enzyme [Candidatus Atribacteria bacterium]
MLKKFNCLKFDTNNFVKSVHEVVEEFPLSIFINGRHFVTAMISPQMVREFVIGYLFSEKVIENIKEIESLRIEANIAGLIGFGRAIDYLKKIGMDKIKDHEARLTERLLEGLCKIRRVEVYGSLNSKERVGVVSFNIKNLNPHDVALMLDEASNIMVRSGHHCCMPLMEYLGLKEGTVRISLYLYNTEEEIDTFLETIREIVKC